MSRATKIIESAKQAEAKQVEAEVQEMSLRPDDIPAETWTLIQENGALATERLNELLSSTRFSRLKVADQAKLIALAQNRAYGMPKTNNAASAANKRRGGSSDVTATELRQMADRTALPEYRMVRRLSEIEDAEFVSDKPT